jgi:PAS domain S-box-containing protein
VERCEEDTFLRADGGVEWIEWEVRPWWKPNATIGGLLLYTQLITERIRMKEALRASEERFRSALLHSPIGMALLGTEGQFLEVNPALCSVFGYTRDELLARTFPSIVVPEDLDAIQSCMREAVARQRDSLQLEKRCRHHDGKTLWIQVSCSLIRNASGTPRHFVVQIQDTTAHRRAEEQRAKLEARLRQSQKLEAIGTLAGGIAHDFNNILGGIMGNLQLAELELPASHPAAALLDKSMQASRRARDLVARILTFSRRSEHQRVPTSLRPVIEETLQLLRATVPSTVEINARLAEHCPPVRCDAAQIHQTLLNLGGNAAAAMRERGGRMDIELRHELPSPVYRELHPQVRPQHSVRLIVRDNGHGMSAAVRERIFEPFFTTKGPGEGTGLGLAVVHGIMEDLGGAIVVESEEGVGTTFELLFPPCAAPSAGDPAAPTSVATSPPPGQAERILVVDDDATVLAVAGSVLRRHGYRPETFARASNALAAIESNPHGFALVVTDLTMPELTGLALARRIRTLNPALPVLLASGYLDESSRTEMEALSLAGWLQKPYDVSGLISQVRTVLERRSTSRTRLPGESKPRNE